MGNFDIYTAFVKSLDGDVEKLRKFHLSTDSVFAMFGLFLRDNLATAYVHHNKVFRYGAETLAYAIQPQLLLEHKRALTQDCMLILDEKDEREFELINNPSFHPYARIVASPSKRT